MAAQRESDDNPRASISVVVPSYNHGQFVGTCLRSIINQTLQPSYLLVIDDGSTDGSPQIISSILKSCPFPCDLMARENRGLSATLNQGLELTGGDFFAYLGSDDIWLDGFLDARIKLLLNRPAAVLAYGHAYFVDEQNRVVDCTADWADYKDGDVREMLLRTIGPMSPTVLYRRNTLARHAWNESARLEDYELYLKLSLDGEFAFDTTVLSAWRLHEKNASWNQQMMLEEHIGALKAMAPDLGLGGEEIEQLLREVRFNRAEDFLRIGEKKKAATLAVQNFKVSTRLLPIVARLLIPYSVVSWRRKRKQRVASERYGVLKV